jgi:hypothetical protein
MIAQRVQGSWDLHLKEAPAGRPELSITDPALGRKPESGGIIPQVLEKGKN